ncbi:unnamed protein product [Arabidopsis arenosa]|uniref:TIR domain-containing protein n=1 Tax=Arabidopsis arenosa TaxID=38785 RepID=A0A8S2B061_ARAAE|nr:unnamed protein product [Arabidopsis arenosa]
MLSSSGSRKPQVFINFRGKAQRDNIVSFLKSKLEEISDINVFIDEDEIRGRPISILFQRIRESSIALVIFSNKYPESCWCLDELVEIKKQMDTGSLVPFPIFYKVEPDSVKTQRGYFLNTLLKTEDYVRQKVDRSSSKSILETEARIWGWRQALVSVCERMGSPRHHKSDKDFVSEIAVGVKKILDDSSPKNYLTNIERPPMHPQEEVTSFLQALNLNISDLEDLITKPSEHFNDVVVSLGTDDLVFLDLISLQNPILASRLSRPGQAGKILLVLLGSLEYCNEGFDLKLRLLPEKHQQFLGNEVIVPAQEIQDRSDPLSVQVTYVVADRIQTTKSNENLSNRLGEDYNSNAALICFLLLCNIQKRRAMISCPPRRVLISFGEKQLGKYLVILLKNGLESNQISMYVEDEMKGRISESRVTIVVFSKMYPTSKKCLDELVEIKKLMDAGEIDTFPIFYNLTAESVKKLKGWFRNRLLKIEDAVRKNVKRRDDNSILDTEARIWGWRQALSSIASRPGLSYQHSNDEVFVSDVVTNVKKLFAFRETSLMHRQDTEAATTVVDSLDDDLFYSHTSFLQALNLETTDLEGFTKIPKGLVSLRLKGHTDLVFLNFSSTENLVRFQSSGSFKFLEKEFAFSPSGVIRIEEPSLV